MSTANHIKKIDAEYQRRRLELLEQLVSEMVALLTELDPVDRAIVMQRVKSEFCDSCGSPINESGYCTGCGR